MMLRHSLTTITTFCIIVGFATCENGSPQVTTPLGEIKGSILTTVRGKTIYSFRGIRYAKPPINELRFQPPVPVDKWDDVYDATKDGPMCPQPDLTPTSEDCLFVNVYTTKLPENGENPKRPVIVFIHFGGYAQFTGSSAWIGPEYILDEDIVFVTMNYRLGALGFLNTEDQLAPGNNGIKDQVVALKWVKANVASFGGDPDLITVSGCSVGGVSVTLHLVSPMSKGLFHRAIAMSGSSYGNWPVNPSFKLAQKQAQLVGCPNDTSANIINCLKTKSAQELIDSSPGFQQFGTDPILVWHPVIEPDFRQERFLIENPVKTIECGEFTKVPVMTGITEEEVSFLALILGANSTLLEEMINHFNEIAPISFLYERGTEQSKYTSEELKKFYIGENPSIDFLISGIGKLYADSIVGFSINRVATLLAKKSSEPVYYYKSNYQGRYSNFYKPGTKTPY
ncbi:hypothetical protein ILUMI_14353, partial [Ignelater luminosus]